MILILIWKHFMFKIKFCLSACFNSNSVFVIPKQTNWTKVNPITLFNLIKFQEKAKPIYWLQKPKIIAMYHAQNFHIFKAKYHRQTCTFMKMYFHNKYIVSELITCYVKELYLRIIRIGFMSLLRNQNFNFIWSYWWQIISIYTVCSFTPVKK